MIFPINHESGQAGGQAGGQVGGQVDLTKRQQEILLAIDRYPEISRKELALKFGKNESAIQKHINKLKELKKIERIGTTTGHWKIL